MTVESMMRPQILVVEDEGVLEDRPRSATVRAAAPVEAELIERQAFLDRVIAEPELARKVFVRMSARLRDVEDVLTRIYTHGGEETARDRLPAPAAASYSITLAAATKRARAVIGGDPIAIERLPFTVGRRPEEGQAAPMITPDLAIPEPAPYRLSRAHFSLIAEDGGVVVRDLGSTLGTIVNNRSIGRDFPLNSVPLHQGDNTILAGGRESPFVFMVTLSCSAATAGVPGVGKLSNMPLTWARWRPCCIHVAISAGVHPSTPARGLR